MDHWMWHYGKDDKTHGPMSEQGLKSLYLQGVIDGATLVWCDGMPEWVPLEKTELAAALKVKLPDGDQWRTCAYSGDTAKESEMVQLDGFWIASAHKNEAIEFLQQGGHLPKAELPNAMTGCVDLGHLLRSGWVLFTGNLLPAIALYLMIWIPGNLLLGYLDEFVLGDNDAGKAFRFQQSYQTFFGNLVTGGIFFLYSHQVRGVRKSFGEMLGAGFSNWGRLWVIHFLGGLLAVLGVLLLIVPGILFVVRTMFDEAAAVDGRMRGTDAMRRSWDLSKGHFWRTTGYCLLVLFGCLLPSIAAESVIEFVPPLNHWVPHALLTTVLEIPLIYFSAFLFMFYKELEARARTV